MGVNKSKLRCLILPAQSGKTRKVEEEIKRFNLLNDAFGKPDDINIWISANNKLLVHQTTSRIRKDLCEPENLETLDNEESNAVIKGKVFSWTSGTKKTNISPTELAFGILNGIDMVVLCAHSIRVRYLVTMLNILTNCPLFIKKINIWIDEADKTINIWSKYPEILSINAINHVTLVSATFNTVVAKYGKLKIIPFNITHPPCYRRLKDAKRKVEDVGKSTPKEYVKHVITKHKSLLTRPGMRAFIPGDYSKQSHEEIAKMLIEDYNFAVIILNGSDKTLYIPDKEPVNLTPYLTVTDPDEIPDEFNITLAKMYIENELFNYPLAITGFICVERGITFQCAPNDDHDGFLFDYGIIPPIQDKAEAYQTMARLFGNIGDFPDYTPCNIYSNSATFKRVENQEEIAVNLARIVYEQGLDEVGIEHLREAANYETEKDLEVIMPEPFTTREEANRFLVSHGCNQNYKQNLDPDDTRFMLESTTKKLSRMSYDQVMKDLSGFSKSSGFDIRGSAQQAGRMYICYRDINDPESAVYITRVVKKKPATNTSTYVTNEHYNPFD